MEPLRNRRVAVGTARETSLLPLRVLVLVTVLVPVLLMGTVVIVLNRPAPMVALGQNVVTAMVASARRALLARRPVK